MIDRATIDRIFAAADIVEVVSDFVSLRRKGVNYGACCPFHNEKTPSFVVSPAKGLFKCFGCGKGGNAVTFVMEHEGMSYVEALKYVGKKYGIEVVEREMTEEETRRNDDRESMMVVNSWAAEWFADSLWNTPEGKSVGLSYFRHRGFSEEMIRKFQLGYCPGGGRVADDGFSRTTSDQFTRAAMAAGYKEQFLVSTGLTIVRESGGYYDRFSERVIFPVHSMSGRVVAFGGRTLRTDKNVAKYQNSPESEVYSKKNNLYGIFFAKKAISQLRNAILVEGYTDVISMHQAGVENVVASSGTSLTTEQVKLLRRFTENVTVIYDGDDAGIKASLRGIDMILREGLNVRVVLLPEGEDPDSFARSRNATELQDFIRTNEEDFLSFKSRLLVREARGDVIKRAEVVGEMVNSIAEIPDAIRRSMYIKECAAQMDVDPALLTSEVAKKRLSGTAAGDGEAREFIRRQEATRRLSTRDALTLTNSKVTAGSNIGELEKEITKYLIKYGHEGFDFHDGGRGRGATVRLNVAATIVGELRANGFELRDRQYRALYDAYVALWEELGEGVEVPAHHFVGHEDPEVAGAAVDLLTADDNYTPSKLWKRHEMSVASERERLGEALPRAIILYKSKVIEELSAQLRARLAGAGAGSVGGGVSGYGSVGDGVVGSDGSGVVYAMDGDTVGPSEASGSLSEAEVEEILRQITALDRERTLIARRLERLIL